MTDGPQSEQDKRTNLGRGLAALFGEEEDDLASLDKVRSAKSVPVERLHPNRLQPRQKFDEEQLEALSASIRENGILQPILVRRRGDQPGDYEIVAGERRWRAAQLAKLHEVPVVIRDLSDEKSLEIAIVENVQRQDLNALEEAEGYQRLIEEFRHSQSDIARALGKSRSHVANMVRLLSLPREVKELIEQGRLSAGHGRALLSLESPIAFAHEIVAKNLNVRQVEDRVRQGKSGGDTARQKPAPPGKAAKDTDTIALEASLASLLGLKVSIDFTPRGGGEQGSLAIHFETLEQLDDVLRRLNQTPKPHM